MTGNVRTIRRPQDQFVMVPNDFARDHEIPPSAFRVAIYIMSHTTSWQVSQESIGRALNMSAGTVASALASLVGLGYAYREKQHDRTGRKPDVITISCERLTDEQWVDELFAGQSPTTKSPSGKSPSGESPSGKIVVPKKSINSKKTKDQEDQQDSSSSDDEGLFAVPEADQLKSKTPTSDSLEAEFEFWWKSVPKKMGRGQALRAWRTARKGGASVETLTNGMARAAAHWAREKTAPQFIPYPASWLNRQGWLDDLVPSAASPGWRSQPGPGVVHTAEERREQQEWFAKQQKAAPISEEMLKEIMGDMLTADDLKGLR